MAEELTPAAPGNAPLVPQNPASAQTSWSDQFSAFTAQPAVRKSIPALVGLGGLAAVAALYMSLAGGADRVLYSSLTDGERAQVVETLTSGGIAYEIDSGTGMVTVSEADLYRARMLVASNGALAAPETGNDILSAIPMGASRTMEGERMRIARERELMLTIMEIDGIEAVRVHLATPERSVFVRDKSAPSASVMLRLARGSNLEKSQVDAIVNLVSGSVPGLSSADVRVVDQHGKLLSANEDPTGQALDLQARHEAKLQAQLASLLAPMLGEGNFSTEVQVELDRAENTSARESYDPESVVRSESQRSALRTGPQMAGGVPGVLANTPPPPNELAEEAPQGGPANNAEDGVRETEESSQRNFAIGREVTVTSNAPGTVTRLSVAVAVSEEALEAIAPADADQIQSLVEAAVGANAERGDAVTVVVGKFDPVTIEPPAFYETAWFAMAARYGAALIAVLLGLLLGVRPILKALRGDEKDKKSAKAKADGEDAAEDEEVSGEEAGNPEIGGAAGDQDLARSDPQVIDGGVLQAAPAPETLDEQIALARELATQQPERAVSALQRMLASPANPSAPEAGSA